MNFESSLVVPMVFPESSLLEGIDRAADHGADAIEFFDWETSDLDAVAKRCDRNGCSVAAIPAKSGSPPTAPHLTRPEQRTQAIERIESAIDAANAVGCSNVVVTAGESVPGRSAEQRDEAIVRVFESVAPTAEREGVTLLLEPLNARVSHPNYSLVSFERAVDIALTVGSDAVDVLLDVYHYWVAEESLPPVERTIDDVGHVHIADAPGRNEPGTGQIPLSEFFSRLESASYEGTVGAEYMPSDNPDDALDPFLRLFS